jgi:tetratricopeptide (TPR) repeat protein
VQEVERAAAAREPGYDGAAPIEVGGSEAILGALIASEGHLAAGNLEAARQQLMSLEHVTPATEQIWKRLHTLCLKLNDRTRAQVYTERFLGVCNDNASAHLAYARNFGSANRDRDRILEAVAAALRNPGSDAGFWREVAKLQSDVQEHELACDSARKAISLDPGNVEIRELLISSLRLLKRGSQVRTECALLALCLRQSKEQDPLCWARLARLAAEAEAKKQARAYIDVAAGLLSKADHGAEFELIRALIFTRQPKRVMRYLDSLLSDRTRNTWLWTTLIDISMSRRYYDIALKAIAGLRAIPYQDPELLYRMSLHEKTARSGGFLKRIRLDWIWSRV